MARTLWVGGTQFYRALIEEFRNDEWVPLYAFGPYSHKGHAQDREARWHRIEYANGTRRKRVQVQDVDAPTGEIVWRDVES